LTLLMTTAWAQVTTLRCDGLPDPLCVAGKTPQLSWQNTLTHNGQRQCAYEIEVASDSGALGSGRANLWRSGRVESEQQQTAYRGAPLGERQRCYWRVRSWDEQDRSSGWSEIGQFTIGPLSGIGGEYIGCLQGDTLAETPMFRKVFRCSGRQPVMAYINSLGYHRLYVNGRWVDSCRQAMQPAVSQLDRHSLTVGYDITPYLHKGKNVIEIWMGQGWGRIYHTPALLKAELCELHGRTWRTLSQTGASWQSAASGYSYTGSWQPLQFGGEQYDARIKPCWQRAYVYDAGTPMGNWKMPDSAQIQEYAGSRLLEAVEAQAFMPLDDGSLMVDFGQVVTGWLVATLPPLPAGQVVTMEYLDHIGALPPHTECDRFVSGGEEGDRHFANRFHMHTFRYVRIGGLDSSGWQQLRLYARPISAVDPREGASFSCSDQRLVGIHNMVKETLSHLAFGGYMVDCPHLERMGYGGDGNSSTPTLMTLWDVRDTYRNWMRAWDDAIDSLGDLPYVAPAFRTGGGPYWSGFVVKAPWRTYLYYGDSTLIGRHYDLMRRWLQYVEQHSEDDLLQAWGDSERHSWFLGDWLAPDGVDIGGESVLHASNCFISDCLSDMVRMAQLMGRDDEARLYAARRRRINEAIHRHFYHPERHTYANGTPLDQAYALLMGIPPDSTTRWAVSQRLLDDCHGKYNDHIAAGLMGVPIFTQWCISERQAELMATILRQPDYPGYLYMMSQGATTTWESWGCGMEGKEDRSRVHNCYNGIGVWFYQALAGIRPDPDHPGFRHFFVDPQPVTGIDWLQASQPTPYGEIAVGIREGTLHLTVPVGTSATLFPGSAHEQTLPAGQWSITLVTMKLP